MHACTTLYFIPVCHGDRKSLRVFAFSPKIGINYYHRVSFVIVLLVVAGFLFLLLLWNRVVSLFYAAIGCISWIWNEQLSDCNNFRYVAKRSLLSPPPLIYLLFSIETSYNAIRFQFLPCTMKPQHNAVHCISKVRNRNDWFGHQIERNWPLEFCQQMKCGYLLIKTIESLSLWMWWGWWW